MRLPTLDRPLCGHRRQADDLAILALALSSSGCLERQRLPVCFADLTHYAKLVDTLGSEGSLEVLQEFYCAAGDVIAQRSGRIRKYISDAILFTFENPRNATQAAYEIAQPQRQV